MHYFSSLLIINCRKKRGLVNYLTSKFKMKKYSAFTLLELIIVIAIAGILSSLALPMFNSTFANASLTSNVNLMVGAINLARSEAVHRGATVTVDLADDSWSVKQGAALIKQFEPKQKGISVDRNSASVITYLDTGFRLLAESEITITVCNDELSTGRDIIVSKNVGKVSVEESTSC